MHQGFERDAVVTLPGAHHPGQRSAAGVGQQVNLRGQPAPGTPNGLPINTLGWRAGRITGRITGRIRVIRPRPLWASARARRPPGRWGR